MSNFNSIRNRIAVSRCPGAPTDQEHDGVLFQIYQERQEDKSMPEEKASVQLANEAKAVDATRRSTPQKVSPHS
jgi:hypothetical protein